MRTLFVLAMTLMVAVIGLQFYIVFENKQSIEFDTLLNTQKIEQPNQNEHIQTAPLPNTPDTEKKPKDQFSPYDHIKEKDIKVYKDRVVINVQNPQWAKFTDTDSMDPTFDTGANTIQIIPESNEQIHVGDIVSYRSEYAAGVIIHRVINIDADANGWYAELKGDNNILKDPGKIRFNQIERVTVGIVY